MLLNADEESGSLGSGDLIATLGEQHDVVLSYEPTAAKEVAKAEGVLLAAAGGGPLTMSVKGRSAHAGVAPELGRNALIEAAHQMLQTRDIAKDIPGAQPALPEHPAADGTGAGVSGAAGRARRRGRGRRRPWGWASRVR